MTRQEFKKQLFEKWASAGLTPEDVKEQLQKKASQSMQKEAIFGIGTGAKAGVDGLRLAKDFFNDTLYTYTPAILIGVPTLGATAIGALQGMTDVSNNAQKARESVVKNRLKNKMYGNVAKYRTLERDMADAKEKLDEKRKMGLEI